MTGDQSEPPTTFPNPLCVMLPDPLSLQIIEWYETSLQRTLITDLLNLQTLRICRQASLQHPHA